MSPIRGAISQIDHIWLHINIAYFWVTHPRGNSSVELEEIFQVWSICWPLEQKLNHRKRRETFRIYFYSGAKKKLLRKKKRLKNWIHDGETLLARLLAPDRLGQEGSVRKQLSSPDWRLLWTGKALAPRDRVVFICIYRESGNHRRGSHVSITSKVDIFVDS